ncbi:MAG TPA: gamma-glutamyltransferase [Melioribacteraceae bacterium]|nr:gamma-glutamyltransferase [Melioribacteraceae bacterium]
MSIYSKIFIVFFIFTVVLNAATYPERSKNGMVVSASPFASEVGVEILKKGGNAVDAAVAVGFALAVTYPAAGNIGGGGFFVIHLPDGKNVTIDFREKAPLRAHKNMFLDDSGKFDKKLSQMGMTSSGIPGSVAGLIYALETYGSLPLSEVIQPAINLAEKGFKVGYRLASSINQYNDKFSENIYSRKIFTDNGNKLTEDFVLIQKDLAKTLKLIKDFGLKGFYEGEVADLLINQSKKHDGYFTKEDLLQYRPIERNPVIGEYKGYKIISMGPPSSGGIALNQSLNILSYFDIKKDDWGSSDYYHKLIETLKYVYADRSQYLGDEDFVKVPKDKLLSKLYAKEIFNKIDDNAKRSNTIFPEKLVEYESKETTHYNVMDKNGCVVSATVTLNSSYGNKLLVEGAGFLMNNEMDDFSAKPGEPNQFGLLGNEANSIEPGKRMLSSMTPTIVLKDDSPFLSIGSPGGSTIITVVLQVLLNVLEFEMNISEAIDAPRIHHQWHPDKIEFEKYSISRDVKENLLKKGHIFGEETSLGRAEGIMFDFKNKIYYGATDPRGFGKAIGY